MISRVKSFVKNSFVVYTLFILAAVDTILYIFNPSINLIVIIDLIIALIISLAFFDERIIKLEKGLKSVNVKLLKLNKKGLTQLVAVIIWILAILLLIALFTGQSNFVSQGLGLNLTR